MKTRIIKYILGFMLLTSCHETSEVMQPVEKGSSSASAITLPFVEDFSGGDLALLPETRTSVQWSTVDGKPKVEFLWSKGDKFAVFSNSPNSKIKMCYTIMEDEQGESQAYFSTTDFGLKTDGTANYYAFVPWSIASNENNSRNYIKMDYSGQNQRENKSTAHLGAYDYQAAYASVGQYGAFNFKFKHLGAIFRIRAGFDASHTFKKFEMVCADNYEFQYERVLDLTEGGEIDNYAPLLDQEHAPKESSTQQSFTLDLGKTDPAGAFQGISVVPYNGTVANLLVLYLMVPATDELKGKPMYGIFTDIYDNKWYMPFTGMDFKPGTYNTWTTANVPSSGTLLASIRVNKTWQQGDTKDETRAIGDPGIDDKLTPPTHLYMFTCKDGTFIDTQDLTPAATDWTDNGDHWFYNKTISVDYGTDPTSTGLHSYFIASDRAIDAPTLSKGNTAESVLTDWVFDLPTGTADVPQTFLKNIYVTDVAVGKGAETVMSAVLNHLGAKLDVQWNSVAGVTGTVSVNSLPTAGLKMFDVTNNEGSTKTLTPSYTLDLGSKWNGRAVFYVPQLASKTYNITVGSSTEDHVFTADPDPKKGASWLKANIKLP